MAVVSSGCVKRVQIANTESGMRCLRECEQLRMQCLAVSNATSCMFQQHSCLMTCPGARELSEDYDGWGPMVSTGPATLSDTGNSPSDPHGYPLSVRVDVMKPRIASTLASGTGCAAEKIEFGPARDTARGAELPANACGRSYTCTWVDGEMESGLCKESGESLAASIRQAAIGRLSLETGCSVERVTVGGELPGPTDDARVLRLAACGRDYICDATPQAASCRAALVSAADLQ